MGWRLNHIKRLNFLYPQSTTISSKNASLGMSLPQGYLCSTYMRSMLRVSLKNSTVFIEFVWGSPGV